MQVERDAMKRSSQAAYETAASDQRLMKALMDIETLTAQLESEKVEHRNKVRSYKKT